MAIPPRFLNELRDRLTLSDIVGKRVKLTRAGGREFKGCCPFHSEKTPSFTLNDDKQFYHCFGCGAHGDVIGFVMQSDNLTFIEAIEALAGEAGMQVPQQTPQEIQRAKKQKDLYTLLEDATKWFEAQLRDPKNREALDYMRERGVSDDLMAQFRIGFAPENRGALWQHLKGLEYKDQEMVDAGVVRYSKHGGDPYSFFRERIMFPVTDRRGRIVAFGGRILPDHLLAPNRGDYKPAKYMNSSDSDMFHKGRMLYGESHARQAAADGEPVIVVEGYLDVMACFDAGYRGAVAPLGTAMTEEQIIILWKMIREQSKTPILCFDGDNAGRRAAARACERILPLLQPDQSALFAFLPEGQDPDSLIKAQGKAAFARVIENAMPLAEFVWTHHTAGRSFDSPEARAGLAKQLEEDADQIADRTVQQYYRQNFRDKLYKAFGRSNNFKKNKGRRGYNPQKPTLSVPVGKPVFSGDVLPYRILLATIINHPAIFDQIEEDLGGLALGNERLDLLRQTVLNTLGGDATLETAGLCDHLREQGFETELRSVLSEAVYTHAGFARPGADESKALSGWREIMGSLNSEKFISEYKQAGRLLGQDPSPENEEKMMALYKMHNVNKAGNE